MRRTPVALIPIVVSAILAGCSGDQQTTAPRTIAPRAAASGVLTPTCDASAISQNARKYFPGGDSVFAMISDMQKLIKTSLAVATPKGFEVLARTANIRRAGKQTGTNVQGGVFVTSVVACMFVGTIPDTFRPDSALGYGVFEVRTSASSEGPTVAFNALTAKTTTVPLIEWGAERNSSSSSSVWPSVVEASTASDRYLVYGYPLGSDVTVSGFELGTLPVSGHAGNPSVDIQGNSLDVGICTVSVATDPTGKSANLLVHNGTEILSLQKLAFCSQTFTVGSSGSWLRSLPSRLFAMVKPTDLFAQLSEDDVRFVGGLPSGWSPFTPKKFAASSIALSFSPTGQPVDTKISGPLDHIVVQAAAGTVPPINVRLTIANNSGQPAFLTTSLGGPALSYVDAPVIFDGTNYVATFDIGFTKAGGYTLTAIGFIGGGSVTTAPTVSALFNVKNQ